MRPAMEPQRGPGPDRGLLDEDAWDAPRRLTDDDLYDHAGPGWRRAHPTHMDMEEER